MVLNIEWCKDNSKIEELVEFFIRNTSISYISCGEIKAGLAIELDSWSEHLRDSLYKEFSDSLTVLDQGPDHRQIAYATLSGKLVGIAIISLSQIKSPKYCILEDMIVDQENRGLGIGREIIAWLENKLKTAGFEFVFLESGVFNVEAHKFFMRNGYETCSKVFYKKI